MRINLLSHISPLLTPLNGGLTGEVLDPVLEAMAPALPLSGSVSSDIDGGGGGGERLIGRTIPQIDVVVYGYDANEIVGDKAGQLIEKTSALRDLGFHTPHRTVLGESIFNRLIKRQGFGDSIRAVRPPKDLPEEFEFKISLTTEDVQTLLPAFQGYADGPLVVRSSAQGDARGIGIYKSVFTNGRIASVARGISDVLSSYFSRSAQAFRHEAQTGEGFGMIIEPMIGHTVGAEGNVRYAPILSGTGYTSSP